jgi:hypothetical protein
MLSALCDVPEPWLGWLAVALCRQRLQQRWILTVRDTLLDEDGVLQGDLPGWTCTLHPDGLILTGAGGERLEVSLDDDEREDHIDPCAFAGRILALDPAPLPEAMCQAWLGHPEVVYAALRELEARGLLAHPGSSHRFCLAGPLLEHWGALAAVDFSAPESARWRDALGEEPGEAPPEHRERFWTWARGLLTSRQACAALLEPLCARLERGEAETLCLGVLRGPLDAASGRAVVVLDGMSAGAHPAILALLDRLDPTLQHPYAPRTVFTHLLRWRCEVDRVTSLVADFAAVEAIRGYATNPLIDELVMLLLEHAPDRSVVPLRRALRHGSPASLATLSTLLLRIDEPWATAELAAALRESTDATRTAILSAAVSGEAPAPCLQPAAVAALAERLRGRLATRWTTRPPDR